VGLYLSRGGAYLEGLGFGIGRCRAGGVGLEVDSHHRIHIVVVLGGHSQIAAAATERLLVMTRSLSEL